MVVIEDGGRLRGLEVLHPRLAEGKAEYKSAGIIILQHEYVKRCLALELYIHRDYVHFKPGGLAHLPESHHNIIRKVVGLKIFDVVLLGDHAQALCGFLIAAELGIPQFHGSLQYLFLQCFADVRSVIQSFGYSALGNPQLISDILNGRHKKSTCFFYKISDCFAVNL